MNQNVVDALSRTRDIHVRRTTDVSTTECVIRSKVDDKGMSSCPRTSPPAVRAPVRPPRTVSTAQVLLTVKICSSPPLR